MAKPKKLSDVDSYISKFPVKVRKNLRQMRSCIRSAAPKATESLKWGTPAFSYHRILVQYAAFKNHISLYPTPDVIKKFAKQLSRYQISKSTIQFQLDKPLPIPLIKRIVKFRVNEVLQKDKRWM